MSFFGELISSIETGKVPPRPQPIQRALVPSIVAHSKPPPKPQSSTASVSSTSTNLKRKADERDGKSIQRPVKPVLAPGLSIRNNSQPSTPINGGSKAPLSRPVATPSISVSNAPPGKAPPKGSYADIIARAKQAQEQRTQSQVGLIKHQSTNREKVSKLAERRRGEQEKLKSDKLKPSQKPAPGDKNKLKRTSSPAKSDQPRVPKAPRPPLHAPASSYKGTMGTAANKPRDSGVGRAAKRSRVDEYMGTDEEDDDEMEEGDDDGYGYGSDESSDMEAGMDDIEREDAMALRAAREDDARELALETKLKREKEDRRKKLEAMVKKGR